MAARRIGKGYKASLINDRQGLPPPEDGRSGQTARPSREVIGNLFAKLPAGGRIAGTLKQNVPEKREKKVSAFPRICDNVRDRYVKWVLVVNN